MTLRNPVVEPQHLELAINNREIDNKAFMSDTKFFEGYSRWLDDEGRYESWDEAVSRVMNMHRRFYADKMTPELEKAIDFAEDMYKNKRVLGAQRALQFGGEQLLRHQMKLYNCTSTHIDRAEVFGELFYILLCGAGAGFSVQRHHVDKVPDIAERKKQAKQFIPDDSIEGWADTVDVLLSSYFVGGGKYPEYEGRKVYFDLSQIRPKGSKISGGFKAPGPEPLRKALDNIEHLIQGLVLKGITRLSPIHVYDIIMFIADAVLSGGVRRSATICLFSPDDQEMLKAKTGNWLEDHPQRKRSNNSALIIRNKIKKEDFHDIMKAVKEFGEPGFIFAESTEHAFNPCVEVGMLPTWHEPDGSTVSGVQGCNLTEINGGRCNTLEDFMAACEAGAILGTLQAGYTDFKFLPDTVRKIFEREALLGVSITGWMNSPDLLFDKDVLKAGAERILEVNENIAGILGINVAARATNVKPSGNASVLLMTASGIHEEHSKYALRHVTINKESEVGQLIKKINPYMVEESVHSSGNTDFAIAFPLIAKEGSIYKKDTTAIDFLEKVKLVQQSWVEFGTRVDKCVDPTLRHNVSNTVTVGNKDWDNVTDYLFDNRYSFAGVSFMGEFGDKAFSQAPFAEVLLEDEIVERYGRAAMFASGLIVDTFKGFHDLWQACSTAMQNDSDEYGEQSDMRADWVRRFKKFADTYFEGNLNETADCLKSVYYLHKWTKIQDNMKTIDFVSELESKKYVDIDTLGSAACVGTDGCEVSF